MNATDVQRIENELAVELPEAYRRLLLQYPDSLCQQASIRDRSLCATVKRIIALNQDAERLDDWPNEYLAIGETGTGGYFVIELGDDDPAVDLWCSELFPLDPDAHFDSVEQFASALLSGFEYEDAALIETRPTNALPERAFRDGWSEDVDAVLTLLENTRSGRSRADLEAAEAHLDVLVFSWINAPYGETQGTRRILERIKNYRRRYPRGHAHDLFPELLNAALASL
jgi:hypothetical protein